MLKHVPAVISPELLKTLMEMGHGDKIVLGDGNFPAAAYARRLVRADGHPAAVLLDAILTLMPLDVEYSEFPVALMRVVDGDPAVPATPAIWEEYREILGRQDPRQPKIGFLERFAFYEAAKEAFAVVATGESAIYANILLTKGVVK